MNECDLIEVTQTYPPDPNVGFVAGLYVRTDDRASEGVSSILTKVEIAKDIHLQMWKKIDIWSGKRFAICLGQIQQKLIYRFVIYKLTGS